LKNYFRNLGVRVDNISPAIEARPDVNAYVLRVALNSTSCFTDTTNFPGSCQWLDSQGAIEASLPAGSLLRQEVLFTSPILFFNGVKVGL
jgi:hypothetical protein